MASGSIYGPSRTSTGSNTPPSLRGNAVALTIPRNPASTGGKTDRSSLSDGYREPHENETRNSLSSRYQSHRNSRLSSENLSNSYGAESSSPSSTFLRRPKDRRRGSSPSCQPDFQIRQEGFEMGGGTPFTISSSTPPSNQPQALAPASSPAKTPGLLSRTFSSGATNNSDSAAALKEKLEHCLDSRPSIEQGIDGESVSYLRRLQAKHEVFNAPTVVAAFNIANFSYNDKLQGKLVMDQCADTACILAELGADEVSVAAALLKDILLQSMMTEQQLRGLVQGTVVDLVVKVSRLNDICQARKDMVEASQGAPLNAKSSERISHLLLTLADVHGVLVKLADRLAALGSLKKGSPELVRTAKEALEVFAPMANRLGVWSIKASLEDLAFKALHPSEHAELQGKLKESQDRGTIESALDTLSTALNVRGLEEVDLSGRPKNLYGVLRKMRDNDKGLNQVYDVRALRVVVNSKHDCYAVLQEVHKLWPEVKDRFKDYIRNPKSNGYQSLHTVVQLPDGCPMEIQIRTDKMHFIAEYGVAAHWRYKEKNSTTRATSETQQVNWARWLISWNLELNDLKCRPSGSPPGDSALSRLAHQLCQFPEHVEGCKFAEYAARMVPRPVSPEELAESPVLVVCLDHTRKPSRDSPCPTSIEELPPRCTLGQLPDVLGIPANTHILVNMAEVVDKSMVLADGDRVEVFEAPQSRVQRLTVEQLEEQRQRLQKLFGRSPTSGHKGPQKFALN